MYNASFPSIVVCINCKRTVTQRELSSLDNSRVSFWAFTAFGVYNLCWWQDCSSPIWGSLSISFISGSQTLLFPFCFRYDPRAKRRMLHFSFVQEDAQEPHRRLLLHEHGKQQVLFRGLRRICPVSPFFLIWFFMFCPPASTSVNEGVRSKKLTQVK